MKNAKKWLGLAFCLALLCILLPRLSLTAHAEVVSGTCGESYFEDGEYHESDLTWTFDTETGTLTIEGYGWMGGQWGEPKYVPWHPYRDLITTVTLPSDLLNIGLRAFCDCPNLSSIIIPEGVRIINAYAFSGCTGLTSVTLPEGLTSIDNSAFYNCTGLTAVTIPDSVTSIGSGAFSNCSSLSSLTLPAGLASIGERTFQSCRKLIGIKIPEGVVSIGRAAFNGCSLRYVCLPASLEVIREYAFYSCGNPHFLYAADEEAWEEVLIDSSNDDLTNATYFHYNASDWDPHVSVKSGAPATCTEDGNVTYTCPCGYEWTEEQAKLGHDYVDGQCSRCGKWNPELNPFGDVKEGKYYYNAVLWAITRDPQVTKGVDATHFAPNQTCTRGQVVTFLYNTLA